jgi:glycine oxidase
MTFAGHWASVAFTSLEGAVSADRNVTDVVIVGGGVIGLAIGWQAAVRGMSVTVLDRGATGQGTSRVAAGMIAPISEASPTEPEALALALASASLYPEFAAAVEEAGGGSVGYRRYGTLLVARDADEAAVLERELAFRLGLGLPVRRLRASEARALEPALAPTLRLALEIPDDHAIDPRALTQTLQAAFAHSGGETLHDSEVTEIVLDQDRAQGVRLVDGSEIVAGQVVIAAGPWSSVAFGLPLDARVPLRPVKGQILTLRDPSGPGLLERVLRMQPGYLVPRGDGRYVLGASIEERGFDTSVTVGAVFELLRDASELVPGISELELVEAIAGIRPGTPDNLPIIGPSPVIDRLYWATGHYRHGIMLTPLTAELIVSALLGEEPPALATALTPGRFAGASEALVR